MLNPSRLAVVLCVLALIGICTARADDLPKATELQAKMNEMKKFGGFDDPKLSLQEALDQIMRTNDITIDVNEKAFKAESMEDVLRTSICSDASLPPFTGTPSMLMRKVIARIPKGDPTFVIRDSVIEITTKKALIHEFYRDRPANAPLPPLVHAAIENVPLVTVLKDIARTHGGNIVVDVRSLKEAQLQVTAEFTNVPLDTAAALLADMCGLTTVEIGNVIYVTSKENGRALQLDQEKRRLKGLGTMPDPTK